MLLLILSATGTKAVAIPDGSYDSENSDVNYNLVEPYDKAAVDTSGNFREPHASRPMQTLVPPGNSEGPPMKPQARTLSLPSFLGGKQEAEDNEAKPTSAIGDIAPLRDHPLWKVHKYQGIDLSPVSLPTSYDPPAEIYGLPAETYGPPAEVYGPPPETYGPPAETYGSIIPSSPLASYGPPTDTVGLSQSPGSVTGSTSDALSALDNLSGLANILPADGSTTTTSSLSALISLYNILHQKSNTGLSLEQLSTLASLVSFIQAKSNGAPSLLSNTPGTELSSIASLVSRLPSETASSSTSLLTQLRSFLTKRPAYITRLINALKAFIPSEGEGAFPRVLKPHVIHLPPTKKYNINFGSNHNSISKLTKDTAEGKILPVGTTAKHISVGKVKFLSKFSGIKNHDFSLLGKKSLPLKFAVLSSPLKLKKQHIWKFGKLGKTVKPIQLHILGKLAALKDYLGWKLRKLFKLGIIKSYIPLKLLGKHAAIKSHVISKLVKAGKSVKHIKFSILGLPIKAKKHIISKLKILGKGVKNIKKSLPSKFDILTLPLKLKLYLISKLKTGGKSIITKHPHFKGGLLGESAGIKDIIELKTRNRGFPAFGKFVDGKRSKGSTLWETVTNNLNRIPNFFLGTTPEAEVANFLNLPDLPPISVPANYIFHETGVGRPYVVKYSKAASSTVRDNAYSSPSQGAVPTYEAPYQIQQELPLYPTLQLASTYGTPIQLPQTSGPTQEAFSFQQPQSQSQHVFDSFTSPVASYQGSLPEPRSPTNSYGQPTASYGAVPSETDPAISDFQRQPQNVLYSQATRASATGNPVSQSAYSVPEQNLVQFEVGGPSIELGPNQVAESGYYPQQSYPSAHAGLYPGTSRSDTDIPPEDIHSEQNGDFRPSSLAAATGAGYSRVAFQRSQQDTPEDLEPVRRPEGQINLAATSTYNATRLNGDLQNGDVSKSEAILAATSQYSELRKGK
jgi:hypothetical protein